MLAQLPRLLPAILSIYYPTFSPFYCTPQLLWNCSVLVHGEGGRVAEVFVGIEIWLQLCFQRLGTMVFLSLHGCTVVVSYGLPLQKKTWFSCKWKKIHWTKQRFQDVSMIKNWIWEWKQIWEWYVNWLCLQMNMSCINWSYWFPLLLVHS